MRFDKFNLMLRRSRLSSKPVMQVFMSLLVLISLLSNVQSDVKASAPGSDGAGVIAAANTIVNRYTALAANAAAGSTSLTVTSAAALGVVPGDLILIIQMQGASIDTTVNTAAWGAVTAYNNAGNYEFATVYSVSGNTITLSPCGPFLQRSYTATGKTQVIRVPQYTTLTINAGASITAPVWNGTTGGVAAVVAQTTVTVNGSIDVSGLGFRGGIRDNNTTAQPATIPGYAFTTAGGGQNSAAQKGESIAGFTADYDALGGAFPGGYGRGAPANGGGGGNAHNAGGGGGANGYSGIAWNGQGNPDNSVAAWTTAWNIDGTLTSATTSSGGGRGGYTFSANNGAAATNPPGNAVWGGDNRKERGGLGGRPLINPSNTSQRIFLGGGGGAGDGNNNASAGGAAGGGIVFVLAPTVSGTGTINANGQNAPATLPAHNDAPGGGGGGGSIIVAATTLSNVSINAKGGNGGNQLITNNEGEGPGGGGGGGVVATSGGIVPISVAAGSNGKTNSGALTEFLPNGATSGAAGNTSNIVPFIPNQSCIGVAKTVTNVAFVSGTSYDVQMAVRVVNMGSDQLTNVQVTDNLTTTFSSVPGTTFAIQVAPAVSFPTGGGTITANAGFNGNANTNLLTTGTLNIGSTALITFTVRVTLPAGGPYTYNNAANGTGTGAVTSNVVTDISQNGINSDPDGDGNPGNNNVPTPITLPAVVPTVAKSFAPSPVNAGVASTLTITLANPSASTLTAATLTDNLPVGLTTVAATVATTCGGTVSQTITSVSLSGGTIPATGNCTLTVNVIGAGAGAYLNTIPAGALITSGGTNIAAATSTLTVNNAPLVVGKSFTPPSIAVGGVSQLRIIISNPNSTNAVLNNPGLTDTYPGGVTNAAVPAAATTCGGAVTAAAAGGTVVLGAGNSIPANGSCTITVNVTSSTASGLPVTNTIAAGAISVNTGAATNSNAATANLFVNALPPVITKSFAPTTVAVAGTSTLTFTIFNPNNVTLTGIGFTDQFPAGLTAVNGNATVCGGPANNRVISGGNLITVTGGTLVAGANCTFNVTVTGTTVGAKINTTSAITSTQSGTGDTSNTAILNVGVANLSLAKTDAVAAVTPGGTTTYTMTVSNTGNAASAGLISVVDVLPTGMSIANGALVAGGAQAANWTCTAATNVITCTSNTAIAAGGGTSVFNFSAVTVATTATGPLLNKAQVGGGGDPTNGTAPTNLTTAQCTGTDTPSEGCAVDSDNVNTVDLGLAKSDGVAAVNAGGTTTYTMTVSNAGNAASAGTITVVDVLPTGLSIADGALTEGGAQAANWTCTAVANVITCTSNTAIAAGGTSVFNFSAVTVAANVTSPLLNQAQVGGGGDPTNLTAPTNVTTALCTATNTPNEGCAVDSDTFIPIANLSITKNDGVVTVLTGATPIYTIVVANAGGLSSANNAIFTDPAITGLTVTGVTCGSPTGGAACPGVGVTTVALMQGAGIVIPTLPSGGSVTFTVNATVTAASGILPNTATVTPPAGIIDSVPGNNTITDTDTVLVAPTIAKAFAPNPTAANVNSTLTFTLTNSNAATALTGVAFSDTYPIGLVNATPLAASNTCGGTFTAAAGGGFVNLSGGTIAANSSCTITVAVVAAAGGTYANATGNITSTNGGTGNTGSSTLTVFDASPTKAIVNTSEPSTVFSGTERVTIGEMIRYHLVTRIPQGSFTNVQLLDGLPTGLQFLNDNTATVAFVCNSGAGCMTSSILAGAGLVVTGSSSAVSPTFVVPGAAVSGGPFASGTDVTFSVGNITNSDVDADSEYIVIEFNALVLNVNTSVTINQGTNNVDGSNIVNNRPNDMSLLVSGTQVGATSANVTVAIAEPAITAITKTILPVSASYLPGDSVTYTLAFSNVSAGNTNAATAFGIVLTDTFHTNLTLGAVNITSTQGVSGVATCAGGNSFTAGSSTAGQLVTVNISCLDPGNTVNVTVNAAIGAGTTSGTTISNTAGLTYTSLPGAQGNCAAAPFSCSGVGAGGSGTGERNGSGGSGADGAVLNNYAVTSNTVNSTVAFGSITITKDAVPNNAQDFAFTGSGPNAFTFSGGFSLDDDADGTLPNTRTFNPLVPGSYSLTEGPSAGWSLTGLTCTDPDSGSTTNLGTAAAAIDLDAGENIICTFTNTANTADLVVTKTDGVASVNAGGTTTYTLTLTNNGLSAADNATLSDPAVVGLTKTAIGACTPAGGAVCPTVGAGAGQMNITNLEAGTVLVPTLPNGGSLSFTVTVDVIATSGTVANTFTSTPPLGTTDPTPATTTDTDTVIAINAVNDTGSTVNGTVGGQSFADVLTNDTLNGNPATLANITLAQVSTTNAGVTLNPADGSVNVAPGTPAGNYTVTYQICDQSNPTFCDTATVSVPVVVINAVNDTGSSVNGYTGGQSFANVLTNDTLNGNPATLATITLTQVSTTNAGVTLNPADGSVNVAAGTPAGNYTVTYQICDQANPTICDTATVSVPVTAAPINAVDDSAAGVNGLTGAMNVLNVFTNDTLNGVAVVPAEVTLTRQPGGDPELTLNPNGSVDVAPNTPTGTYTLDYQICDVLNPTNCDIATVTVTVVAAPIVANDDDYSATPVNGYTGGNAGNAFTNDTLNGVAVTPADITATVTASTSPNVTMNTATGVVTVAAGTSAGTYTIDYQICENLNPTNCDPATITVVVNPPVINAVDDSATGINGITGATNVLNVFTNDTLNGVAVVPTEVTLTQQPGGAPELTLNPDGSVDVAPGTAAGTYQLTYQICEVLNPTNCDTAIVSVTVGLPPAPIATNDSTSTPFNTPATLTNITTNDTAFGTGNSIIISTIDLDPAAGQQTIFTDASGNQWSVNTTTGDVTFTPALNFTGVATIPYTVQDAAGQTATANLSVTVAPPASISGVVFHDVDLDGSKLTSESGIVGVIVNLYDSIGTTLIASTTTGAGGTYNFPNLTAGNYLVVEIDPAGYVSSTANSVPVTLIAGGSGTANFGDYQLPNTALSNISGVVFNDANGNGVQDAGETPLSGVTVELENNLGVVIATTTTNASGAYTFTNLPAGIYTVVETDLPGYVSTTLNNIAVTLSAGTNATINYGDQTVVGNPLIADPAVTKLGSPSSAVVGDVVVYTITVGNNGNTNAANVILTDTKPAFLDIISISISPNPGLTPVISGNTFTINFGTVAPTDFYTITVITRVNAQGVPPGGVNNAAITTSSGTDRTFNNASAAQLIIPLRDGNPSTVAAVTTLPDTGFAPNVVTSLPLQPSNMLYAATDLILEVPSLGVKMPIVGVSKKNGTWDVTWLGKQAGWLEGTAFPSWNGNSVLTSHVYDANGLPGPFVNLGKLKYGDKIIIHAYGQKYTFEVRTNQTVAPNHRSALKHEEKPWLTLVTCKEYDEKTNTYKKRVIVRAVLVNVEWDK